MVNFFTRLSAFVFTFILLYNTSSSCQTFDTLSNWDDITQDWNVYDNGFSEVVINPDQNGINKSKHCLRVVSLASEWDNISYELDIPVNFDEFPLYRLKVLAPPTGGDVTLKFQNYNNSAWQEIVKTPVPGQWTDLAFNFSGLSYHELKTLVIFYDFKGTSTGNTWYIDDVIMEVPGPLSLESNLPIVVINTEGVFIDDDPKVTGHMGIIDNGPDHLNKLGDPFNVYSGYIGIETRGNSTQMFPKKSFDFETRNSLGENQDVSLLGMPADNDWILYAPYSDKSMLRNVISLEIGHVMGDYCSRTVYCELVVNNDYRGVYVLMEKIKKGEERVDIATLKPDEVSGDNLTGGYIIRVDWLNWDFNYGRDGWLSQPTPPYPNARVNTFQYYYPKPDEIVPPQRDYIKKFITTAENTLTGADFQNPSTGYKMYFDTPSFIDFMLLNEISKEVDKYKLSTFFYKEKDSDGGKLHAGPAWDFNLGYGNVNYWSPGNSISGWAYSLVESHDGSVMFWWKRMMEDFYFRNLVKTRWLGLRQDKLTDATIQSVIDSVLSHIDVAKDRNYERWPILGEYIWPNKDWYDNDYDDEVNYFEHYLFRRLEWMDQNVTGDIVNPSVGITAMNNTLKIHLYGDYFRNNVLKNEYFKLNDVPQGLTIRGVEYLNETDCLLTLSDDVNGMADLSVTVFEEAINTWDDITSEKLGSTVPVNSSQTITIFEADHKLHVRCLEPEKLPLQADIINLAGQLMSTYQLQKEQENILPHQLKAGFYIIVFKSSTVNQALRFVVVK